MCIRDIFIYLYLFLIVLCGILVAFVVYFLNNIYGQAIKNLGERNKVAVMKWQEMTRDQKKYQQLAAQTPSVSTSCTYDKWHETQRILSNIQNTVSASVCYIIYDLTW